MKLVVFQQRGLNTSSKPGEAADTCVELYRFHGAIGAIDNPPSFWNEPELGTEFLVLASFVHLLYRTPQDPIDWPYSSIQLHIQVTYYGVLFSLA
jgi:hypothetical protein